MTGTMKQWYIEKRDGKLDSLKLREVPKPKPGPGQVLMQGESLLYISADSQLRLSRSTTATM